MSVRFDWDKEDEKRRARQQNDPYLAELRGQNRRRTRNAIIAFLAIPLLMAGIVYGRNKLNDQAIHDAFDQTVDGEIQALRSGNRDAFMGYQQNVKPWTIVQWNLFGDYQSQHSHIEPGSQVISSQNDDLHGQAVVEELVDDVPYHVTWYYDYSEHDGWKQVAPPADAFGVEAQASDAHVMIQYRSIDEAQVAVMRDDLARWWTTACQLTGCKPGSSEPGPITIRVLPDPTVLPRWSAGDPAVMELPSPQLGRIPSDGRLNPEYERAMAELLGEYWARWAAPTGPDATAEMTWFQGELATTLAHGMGVKQDAPLLGRLAGLSGPSAVMALGKELAGGKDLIPALRDISGFEPLQEPYDWSGYLAARLNAESALAAQGKTEQAAGLYGDPEHLPALLDPEAGQRGAADALDDAAPGSIRVTGLDKLGDLYWAQVTFNRQGDEPDAPQTAGYAPFRISGDRWLHTLAAPADLGPLQDQTSGPVALHASTLDQDATIALADDLGPIFAKAATDLGVAPGAINGLDITVLPSGIAPDAWSAATPLPFETAGKPAALPITVASPHLVARAASQSPHEWLRTQIIRALVIELVRSRAYTVSPRAPLLTAIARWELARLGLDADATLPLTDHFGDASTGTLQRLWQRNQGGPFTLEDELGAEALIGLLTQRGGPEAVAALLGHMADAQDMDGWLQASLKMTAEDIRPEWTSAAAVSINANGGRQVSEAAAGPILHGSADGPLDVMLSDSGKTISLAVGQSFRLHLDPNPDHFWSLKVDDPAVITLTGQADAATGAQWTYVASKPGHTRLTATGTWACRLNPGATCNTLVDEATWEWEIEVK